MPLQLLVNHAQDIVAATTQYINDIAWQVFIGLESQPVAPGSVTIRSRAISDA